MIERLTQLAQAPPPRFPDAAPWIEKLTAIKGEGEHDHYLFFRSVFMG